MYNATLMKRFKDIPDPSKYEKNINAPLCNEWMNGVNGLSATKGEKMSK